VKPAPFEYFCPATLDEALALLAEHGSDAKPLAGGQSLIPAMNFRLATPAVLVDLNGIADLAHVRRGEGCLRIGGMTRHRTLETNSVVGADQPLIAETMPFVAHQAIRTRGTIGGSLAHADPAAELPAVMLALEATIKLQKQAGARSVPAAEFFTGLFSTAIEPGEIITEVELPRPQHRDRTGYAFDEISRRHGDFALAGAAAVVSTDAHGVCTSARVALLSVADRPVIAEQVSQALVGQQVTPVGQRTPLGVSGPPMGQRPHPGGQRPIAQLIRDAAEASAASTDIDPASDIHASSRYRRRLAAVLIRRVLERAFHSLESA
jgi:CO/xanthine dehydrogenase FAD-binding subunit